LNQFWKATTQKLFKLNQFCLSSNHKVSLSYKYTLTRQNDITFIPSVVLYGGTKIKFAKLFSTLL